ncbi:MAG: permease-like cell division protein FtsX [Longicatena sp.]
MYVMIIFFKNLPKHFLSAFKSLGRHISMTLSSVSAVSVTLILMAVFLLMAGNINGFTSNVESDLKIHASIDKIATQTEIKEIKTKVENLNGVKSVEFSSKEDELNLLIGESGNVFSRYKENNPMPNVFIVEVEEAKQIPLITSQLNEIKDIEKAQYGGESIENMIKMFEAVRAGGGVFLIALGFIAIFLISNTIKLSIYTRTSEISIMRNVGATNWYIKTPFMIEGMYIGILGSLIPIVLTIVGYGFLYDYLGGNFLSSMFVMQAPIPFAIYICISLVLSGAFVGVLGSFLAVNKYLRWSR